MATDYPVILGMARAALLDTKEEIGAVLNLRHGGKLDDETNNELQRIYASLSDRIRRIQT